MHLCSMGPCSRLCTAASESEEQLLQRAYTAFESTVSPRRTSGIEDQPANGQHQRLMALLREKCGYLPTPLNLEERDKLDKAVLEQCNCLEVGQEFNVNGASRRMWLSESWNGIWIEEADQAPSPALSYTFAVLRSVQLQSAVEVLAVVLVFDPSPGRDAGAPQPATLHLSFSRRVDMLRFALTMRALRSLATRSAPRRRKLSKRKGSKNPPPPPELVQVLSDPSPVNVPASGSRDEMDTFPRQRSPSSSTQAMVKSKPPEEEEERESHVSAMATTVQQASELGELREQLAAARLALEASDHTVAAMLRGDSDVEPSGCQTPPPTKPKKRGSPPLRPKLDRPKKSPERPALHKRRFSEPNAFFHTWPETPDHAAHATGTAASLSPRGGDAHACIICMSSPSCMAFVPCGHRCLCITCGRERAGELRGACPQCRAEFTGIIQIYG